MFLHLLSVRLLHSLSCMCAGRWEFQERQVCAECSIQPKWSEAGMWKPRWHSCNFWCHHWKIHALSRRSFQACQIAHFYPRYNLLLPSMLCGNLPCKIIFDQDTLAADSKMLLTACDDMHSHLYDVEHASLVEAFSGDYPPCLHALRSYKWQMLCVWHYDTWAPRLSLLILKAMLPACNV